MASYFTSDAEFTDIMGQVAQGKEKIEAMHQFVFSKFMRDAVLEQETLYMREIAPNTVLCTLKWRTTGHTNPANQPLPPRSGLMQVIVSELDQQWAITLVHNLDFTHLYNNIEDYTMQPFGPR